MRTLATKLVCGGVLGGEISICDKNPNEFVGECGCFIVTFFPIAAVGDADNETCKFDFRRACNMFSQTNQTNRRAQWVTAVL